MTPLRGDGGVRAPWTDNSRPAPWAEKSPVPPQGMAGPKGHIKKGGHIVSAFFQKSPTWLGSTSPPMKRSCWAFSSQRRSVTAIFWMMCFTVASRAVPSL